MLPAWPAPTPQLCCLEADHQSLVLPSKVLPPFIGSCSQACCWPLACPPPPSHCRQIIFETSCFSSLHAKALAALTGAHLSAAGMYDVFQNTKRSRADRAVEQLAEVEAAARAAQVAAEEAKREAKDKVTFWACRQVSASGRTLRRVGSSA